MNDGGSMQMRREWAMPNADTFSVPVIGDLVKQYLQGVSVDPFARNKRWATHTNDLNPTTAAEHHMDAVEFLTMLADNGVKADVLILDPPYSPRQVTECYADAGLKATAMDTSANFYTRMRGAARRVCKRGTIAMSFGWNSCGMGEGFEARELLLVAHGGAHNDTICFVEEMKHEQITLNL
jgi:tRNA1(Val) A37 N6-methylase TrmN6